MRTVREAERVEELVELEMAAGLGMAGATVVSSRGLFLWFFNSEAE